MQYNLQEENTIYSASDKDIRCLAEKYSVTVDLDNLILHWTLSIFHLHRKLVPLLIYSNLVISFVFMNNQALPVSHIQSKLEDFLQVMGNGWYTLPISAHYSISRAAKVHSPKHNILALRQYLKASRLLFRVTTPLMSF